MDSPWLLVYAIRNRFLDLRVEESGDIQKDGPCQRQSRPAGVFRN